MGSQIVGILGERKFWLVGLKNGKICCNKKVVQKELKRCQFNIRELKIYDDNVVENARKQRYHWLKEHK